MATSSIRHGVTDVGGGFVSFQTGIRKIPIWGDEKTPEISHGTKKKKSLEFRRFRTWKPIHFSGSMLNFWGSKQCKSMAILRDVLLNSVLFGLVI